MLIRVGTIRAVKRRSTAPPEFPSLQGGYLTEFESPAPVNGTALASYDAARYGAVTNANTAKMGQHAGLSTDGYVADGDGNTHVANRILDALTATKFDIVIRRAGNTDQTCGIFFNMTTNDRLTADGYWFGFTQLVSTARVQELWRIADGVFTEKLDSDGTSQMLARDRIGLRWFGDGSWQMYSSENADGGPNPTQGPDDAWVTRGTPSSNSAHLAAGFWWLSPRWPGAFAPSGGLIDGYSLGTW